MALGLVVNGLVGGVAGSLFGYYSKPGFFDQRAQAIILGVYATLAGAAVGVLLGAIIGWKAPRPLHGSLIGAVVNAILFIVTAALISNGEPLGMGAVSLFLGLAIIGGLVGCLLAMAIQKFWGFLDSQDPVG